VVKEAWVASSIYKIAGGKDSLGSIEARIKSPSPKVQMCQASNMTAHRSLLDKLSLTPSERDHKE
jgi:hypothetical protein